MFHTFALFKTPLLRGNDIRYRMFMVPPPEQYDHIIFVCLRNLAGDHTSIAFGTYFQLDRR